MKISKNNARSGFSLVEVLAAIAAIGIIAGIAVPNIGRITDSAKDATYRRNAQNLASVFTSAQAAGLDFSNDGKWNEEKIIQQIIIGDTVKKAGPFKDTYFGLNGLNAVEAVKNTGGAGQYLTWDVDSKQLLYTGGQAPTPQF